MEKNGIQQLYYVVFWCHQFF